ncbi:MAG: hypothetical protein U9N54_01585 [candidate division Zixibacteria bacterium]|nr:hypothetical protein [candidate division Zixibacteria bacterium]
MPLEPHYSLDKIKFSCNPATFERAVHLYEAGKVTQFDKDVYSYTAVVLGTKPYQVSVEARHHDYGHCECYLGQRDTLCKHMVAVALYAVKDGKPLTDEDKEQYIEVTCSDRIEALSKTELASVKKSIIVAMRYIKPYRGPSRVWFAYQGSLSEGCARLTKIVSDLPISEQTAALLVDMLLRLDKKLCTGGVDDSDGTVGGFMEEVVMILTKYASLDSNCKRAFHKLENRETCFGWEYPLVGTSVSKK